MRSTRISGLVVEYIVAIDVTRVRFPADALYEELIFNPTENFLIFNPTENFPPPGLEPGSFG